MQGGVCCRKQICSLKPSVAKRSNAHLSDIDSKGSLSIPQWPPRGDPAQAFSSEVPTIVVDRKPSTRLSRLPGKRRLGSLLCKAKTLSKTASTDAGGSSAVSERMGGTHALCPSGFLSRQALIHAVQPGLLLTFLNHCGISIEPNGVLHETPSPDNAGTGIEKSP